MGSEPRGCARPLLYVAAIGFGAMAALVILSVVMAPFLPERPEPSATTITKKKPPTPESHTVARGDTLSSIAAKYGKTVDYLARRNNLDSVDAIDVGQTLHLEGAAPLRPRRASPVSTAPARELTSEPEPDTAAQAALVLMECVRRNGASEDTCQEEREAWSRLTLEEDEARVRSRQAEHRRWKEEQAKRRPPSTVRPRSGVPIETHDAVLIDSSLSSRQVQTLAGLVKAYGYRCDSVTTARRGFFTAKSIWVLRCNGARYKYRIEDRGGRLVVEVD